MARGFTYAAGASDEYQEASAPGVERARIMELGSHKSSIIRATIAARADCPLGLMVTLAHDFHTDVRCAVARNPTAQRTVMEYLAADRHVEVVVALLENPSLPRDLVGALGEHKKSQVRHAAIARLMAGVAVDSVEEDAHTPELADHVTLAPAPTAPVQFAPVSQPEQPAVPVLEPVAATGAIPQIFAPVSTPERQVPTRTAPVRGFRPPAS